MKADIGNIRGEMKIKKKEGGKEAGLNHCKIYGSAPLN